MAGRPIYPGIPEVDLRQPGETVAQWVPPEEPGLEDDYLFINIALLVTLPWAKLASGARGGYTVVRLWGRQAWQAYRFALNDVRAWKVVGQSIAAKNKKPVFDLVRHELQSLWYSSEATATAVNAGEMGVWKSIIGGHWRPLSAMSSTALSTNPTPIASAGVQALTLSFPVLAHETYKIVRDAGKGKK